LLEVEMSVAKVIEILAEGDSIEAAVESAVREAAKSVRNIRGVYVNDIQALVDGESVTKYRVNAKVTFVVGSGGMA
jgi:dodecin